MSTPLLIQNAAGSITCYLETTSGVPATGLDTSNVQVDLKKPSDAFFVTKTLLDPVDATATIGAGVDGTVTVAVPGSAGNSYTISVILPIGTSSLSVSKVGTAYTVSLAVSAGVPIAAANTATNIAAAINALASEMTAVASGTGADPISAAEGPTALIGGVDGSFTELGAGFYEIDLAAADTDELGTLSIRVTGTTIKSTILFATVAVEVPASPTPTLTVATTSIYGYIMKVDGSAYSGASVVFRVLSQPTILHPGTEGLAVSVESITALTDSTGLFSAELVTGSSVDVYIPAINYRRTFIVPVSSTNLFDLP